MKIFVIVIALLVTAPRLHAAVGCDLNDPDRDVKRLFPGSTGYKTVYLSIDKKGGSSLLAKIEQRLGDRFTGMYETMDVPYTLYEIYRGKEKIGYIHGVNQKGQYGGLQVFLSLDLNGIIREFYFQKLTSRQGAVLRGRSFTSQFIGLSLRDFYQFNIITGKGSSRITAIRNPSAETSADFKAALRATKKNLILMDEFVLNNRHLVYFKP